MNYLTLKQIAEQVRKYIPDGEMPEYRLLTAPEVCILVLKKNNPSPKEKQKVSQALSEIARKCGGIEKAKDIAGITTNNPKIPGSPFRIDMVKAYPFLLSELRYLPDNLQDLLDEITASEPHEPQQAEAKPKPAKQLRPFTSEEFEGSFAAVGAVVRIRLSKDKNIKRTQLAEIEYKPDSESQIQSVTFGCKEYTLAELKDNLEYWRHNQWNPFGVYE